MIRAFSLAACIAGIAAPALAQEDAARPDFGLTVVMRGVDKTLGRSKVLEVETGVPTRFGQLVIEAYTCEKAPPTERPESTAFLQIKEQRRDSREDGTVVFSGWMFASSPALNALEHPVYDVWVTDCKITSGDASAPSR